MANPDSLAWLLEMFGYAALGVATWLVAAGFGGGRWGTAVRLLLRGNGVLSVAGAIFTASIENFVFSMPALVAFFSWNALILVAFGLIAFGRETPPVGGRPPDPSPGAYAHAPS